MMGAGTESKTTKPALINDPAPQIEQIRSVEQEDHSLISKDGYVIWFPDALAVMLYGSFTVPQLRFIVEHMEKHGRWYNND